MTRNASIGVEHIGITVPDHDAALAFFANAFGTSVLFSLVRKRDQPLSADKIGPQNGLAGGTAIKAVSLLRFHNGPNLEVFEIDRPTKTDTRGISDLGISHFSVTADDIEALMFRFVEAGGSLVSSPYNLSGQEAGQGNRGCFGKTPWGLLIEFQTFKSTISYDAEAVAERWFPNQSEG